LFKLSKLEKEANRIIKEREEVLQGLQNRKIKLSLLERF